MTHPSAIAHAAKDASGNWRPPHDLADHLRAVGDLAADFAQTYGADWARLAGRWHDLGKYRPRFQRYIRQASGFEADAHILGEAGKAPHSTAGAVLATERFGVAGRVLAYLIAGHHAGLADWFGGLHARLDEPDSRAELDESLAENPPADLLDAGAFKPDLRAVPGGKDGFALWVRMLFSALVDADFLDTERYMNPEQFAARNAWPALAELAPRFDAHMAALARRADATPVNALRADILAQCRRAAALGPGIFSLTVPTGGGKTLSGMAFALDHARHHGKRRVIHVIPYTSIIEQTADIFRGIFGDAVIEHHSNAESAPGAETAASRLACENWDAPIVVTTNVQFFESLFAARTSRCRKLHNLVDAIVILDEAQLLPPEFLQPILDALNLLTRHYGVTVVLSTATQPALATREYFDASRNLRGLDGVREIIDDPDSLYRALDRVDVRLPADWQQPTDWPTLARELSQHDSVLAIVNRRADARALWQQMPAGTLHLSALMCGAHRSDVISTIKERLREGTPTRVVSTQLVEAGVDVDFPVVYRALAGLDSIAQAAGRCNREGRLPGKGRVVVFIAPKPAPPGLLRKGEDACRAVLHGVTESPLDRARFAAYFERLYDGCQLDAQGICGLLAADGKELAVNFRTAAEKFRLIDDEDSLPIVVKYHGASGSDDSIDTWLAMLRKEGPQRWLMRKLQRYTVTLHRTQALALLAQGAIEEILPGLFMQVSDWLYDAQTGLSPDGVARSAGASIV
ncbi:CRISPR-associated endonuclease Cas3'' [Tibeticola sp.]|uniref:CRISPR-associated endonuclease Cas3'' n=1 Tax=Tibeticola sp. TaxID=2005368 RepID=UPI0025EBCF78|nr:CRISPR-associated endonuclease Cas3'' [Tibeticola sp.]